MTVQFKRILIAGVLLVSVVALLAFGILGVGRSGESNFDGAVLFAAGSAWLAGLNPYSHAELAKSVAGTGIGLDGIYFFYPPNTAAFSVPLALFNYSVAKNLWLGTNLLSIAAIAAITVLTIRQRAKTEDEKLGAWIMAALVIGNPFTTHVVWMGQTSLVSIAALMGAWFFSRQSKGWLAGICLGISIFKPQLCLLLCIWFLLDRQWKLLATAAVSTGVMSVYPLIRQGPIGMMQAWYGGIQESYSSLIFNTMGFQHKVGLQSLLSAAGLNLPGLTMVGVVLAGALWYFRKKIQTDDVLAILSAFTFTFVGYSHDYDYVGLIPVFTALWIHAYQDRQRWLSTLPLFFLMFIPQRFFRVAALPVLNHWRSLVIIGLLGLLLYFSTTEQLKQRSQAQKNSVIVD